ncbi:hypothetical protein JG688_00015107 [Phytophthora aleatoria]|uniref:Uncharacterized protein n=1 Tax=Phytophthora aleatoria TaxID=2496075 RepID=A0A8J5IET5_9STRA|nr:hypothetical protein JG688_00015107 [Phytophthora aleatoria]
MRKQASVRGFCRRHAKEKYPRAPDEDSAVVADPCSQQDDESRASHSAQDVRAAGERECYGEEGAGTSGPLQTRGGGLIKQNLDVAMSNVNKHLELIKNEL